jgi:hypothetical protein
MSPSTHEHTTTSTPELEATAALLAAVNETATALELGELALFNQAYDRFIARKGHAALSPNEAKIVLFTAVFGESLPSVVQHARPEQADQYLAMARRTMPELVKRIDELYEIYQRERDTLLG